MILRIASSLLILISILFFPFWVSIILALLCIVYFRFFWEAVVLFFISDLLFGAKEARFFNIILISTIFSIVVLLFTEFIKKKLKFYQK